MPVDFPVLPGCRQEPLPPFGLLIRPTESSGSPERLPLDRLRALLLRERLLVLRGFEPFASKEQLSAYSQCWGELLAWDFGTVFEVIEQDHPKNYLFTSGSVPYHWDGAFAARVPWLQVFQCQESPGCDQGGETIFCDTARIWEMATPQKRTLWREITIEYTTDKVAHYGGRIRFPLLGLHPLTGQTTLRFAEPANASTVKLNTPELEVHGIPATEVPGFLDELIRLLYAPQYVYSHAWEAGDLVIADNHVLLHGRTPYRSKLPRKLWRVHVL